MKHALFLDGTGYDAGIELAAFFTLCLAGVLICILKLTLP